MSFTEVAYLASKGMISIEAGQFFSAMLDNPLTFFAVLLFFAIIFINGWSDAPCTVTGVIVTETLSEKSALRLAAVCNFFGVLAGGWLFSSLTETMAQFTSIRINSDDAPLLLCICAATVVIFAVLAQGFGIPTSESHALLGSLCGIQFAYSGIDGLSFGSTFGKVLYGLFLSVLIGAITSAIFVLLLEKKFDSFSFFTHRQVEILFAGLHAFLHGLQDGQKLIAMVLFCTLSNRETDVIQIPLFLLFIGATILAIGTRVCSKRMIDTVGREMVSLDSPQTLLSEISSLSCTFFASFFGIPVSTTQLKVSAMMGAAFGAGKKCKRRIVSSLFSVWFVTFPICFLIGFLATKFIL